MNNKGFAISTMLYGLSIVGLLLAIFLIQTMSSTRSEQRRLVEAMEEELDAYSSFTRYFTQKSISGRTTKFKIPKYETGWYKIECWSAYRNGGTNYYTTQTVKIEERTTLAISLGNNTGNDYASRVCNANSCPQSSPQQLIASSTSEVATPASNFTDPNEYKLFQRFPRKNGSGNDQGYLVSKVASDPTVSEYGRVRITLVSREDNYSPYSPSSGGTVPAGTYYILDAQTSKALSYKAPTSTDTIISESLMYQDLEGYNNQKWIYDPISHSIVNHQTHYSLRGETYGMASGSSVYADSEFDSRSFEKWKITNPTGTIPTVQIMPYNSNNVYLFHNTGDYYNTSLQTTVSNFYLIPAN